MTNFLMELHEKGIDTEITLVDNEVLLVLSNIKTKDIIGVAKGANVEQAIATIFHMLTLNKTSMIIEDRLSVL